VHLLCDHGNRFWCLCRGLSELDPTGLQRLEHPGEDAAVVMQVAIERGTATVDAARTPKRAPCRGPGTASAQMGYHPQEDMQHGSDRLWLPLQGRAKPLGHREHPLAHRQGREDVIDEMSGGLTP
jgi:hypothetical protein